MDPIRISAISYTNTLPFVFGIQNSDFRPYTVDLCFDNPAVCAQKLINGEVDLGIVPVGAIPDIEKGCIISKFCIGANGASGSVLLLSNSPLSQIKTVYLDYQSRTSVKLVRVLATRFWNARFLWINAEPGFESRLLAPDEAMVIIGDRALELQSHYKCPVDLSEQWRFYTGLPFVFACWVANRPLPGEFIDLFNKALFFGTSQINRVVALYSDQYSKQTNITMKEYLSTRMSYHYDLEKQKVVELFLLLSSNIENITL